MSLTAVEFQKIVDECLAKALAPVRTDISTLKEDVSTLKTDISTLKTDVSTSKKDTSNLNINMDKILKCVSHENADFDPSKKKSGSQMKVHKDEA